MEKEKKKNENIVVPYGTEYDREVEVSIRRCSNVDTDADTNEISTTRDYIIHGKHYVVKSIFDGANGVSVIDGIKRMIDREFQDKVS